MTLKDQILQDDAVFYNEDEFSVSALLKCGVKPETEIMVILDNPYEQIGDIDGAIAGRLPTALVKTADVADAVQGDRITIEGTAYYIKSLQPDGVGLDTRLVLSEDE